jgi:hypothetical protein
MRFSHQFSLEEFEMAQPIYKFLWVVLEAWYQLSEAEQEGFEASFLTRLLKSRCPHWESTLEDRLLAELHVLGNHTAALQQLGAQIAEATPQYGHGRVRLQLSVALRSTSRTQLNRPRKVLRLPTFGILERYPRQKDR